MLFLAVHGLLLVMGLGYILYVLGRILIGVLRKAPAANDAETLPNSGGFHPNFRKVHFYILLGFCLFFGALLAWESSPGDWNNWASHPYRAVSLTISGPFSASIFDPTPEHWKTAWQLFPWFAPFLAWAIFCQFYRLPYQRNPQRVALIMWIIGLLWWFSAGRLSHLMAA